MSDDAKNALLGANPVDRLLLLVGFAVVSAIVGADKMEPDKVPVPAPVVVPAPVPPPMDAGGVDGVRALCEEALRVVRCDCATTDAGLPGGDDE